MKTNILIINLLFSLITYAQPGPNSNWYFGTNAGITFNSGTPVALTNGALTTIEGVATLSDNSGNLLFYTNGVTVWNRNHLVMTNGTGLLGDVSSTQSAIIIPKPGTNNIFYIFTSDNDSEPNGINYSEVNMSLSGGLGAITANKNIQLHNSSCEKLCAVRLCNNSDMWVISHDWNSNVFRCWGITSFGISMFTWSISGGLVSGIPQAAYGQLKASPDGSRLAICHYGLNKIELHNFNTSTGIVTGGVLLSTETGIYGCEFSSNGNILYAGTNGGLLLQWDLSSGVLSTIQSTRRVVSNLGPFIGSLQIGPDNKIYVARSNTSLSVINNPNIYGVGCNYSNLSISLSGRPSRFGLPNFPPLYLSSPPILNSN